MVGGLCCGNFISNDRTWVWHTKIFQRALCVILKTTLLILILNPPLSHAWYSRILLTVGRIGIGLYHTEFL